jgi:hypothetical protein
VSPHWPPLHFGVFPVVIGGWEALFGWRRRARVARRLPAAARHPQPLPTVHAQISSPD